jgi:hypothetical protein
MMSDVIAEGIGEVIADIDEAVEVELPIGELAADTLRGDIRDAMLSWLKAQRKPWGEMAEHEQRGVVSAVESAADNLVRQACLQIASKERPFIRATLVEYGEKEGIQAKLKLASTGEVVSFLHESVGRHVLIINSGIDEFSEERAPAAVDPDQPSLPIEAGTETEAATEDA